MVSQQKDGKLVLVIEMSTLKIRIKNDMADALRNKDVARLGALRLLWAAIRQREIDGQIELDDNEVIIIINKMIKQRQDSIAQYRLGRREDLAQIETTEIAILQLYLPEQLSDAYVDELIHKTISEIKAVSAKDMGKVITALKPRLQGRADMGKVSVKIKSLLSA